MIDLDAPILLCGEPGCFAVELWADGLCREHFEYDHRAVTPDMLVSGTPPRRKTRSPKGTLLRATGRAGEVKPPELRHVRTTGCAVDGCPTRLVKARGYCDVHYGRWLATGDPGPAELCQQGPPPPAALRATLNADPVCGLATAHLFDPPDEEEPRDERLARQWEAAKLCQDCPALRTCQLNLDDVARHAPASAGGAGVWAAHRVLTAGYREVQDPQKRRCSGCLKLLPLAAYYSDQDSRCGPCKNDAIKTPEGRAKRAEYMRTRRQDPEIRARINEQAVARRAAETPEQRERRLAKKRAARVAAAS